MFFWIQILLINLQAFKIMQHDSSFPEVLDSLTQRAVNLPERTGHEQDKELAYALMQEYEKTMGLAVDGKISRASTSVFLSLFTANTKIWNDLYVNQYPCAPDEYVAIAYKHLPWGIKATIRYDTLPEMLAKRQYYPISGTGHEFLMHFWVVKTMYNGLDQHNDPIGYPKGREVHLEFIIYINSEKKLALISDIRPQSD